MRSLGDNEVQISPSTVGSGGRYTVYEASMNSAAVVAKTVTDLHDVDLLEIKRDLIAEHETLAKLDHQAIPRTRGLWRDPRSKKLHHIMEYVPGRTLDEIIRVCTRKHHRHGGAMRWTGNTDSGLSVTKEVLSQVFSALAHAHSRHVCHNDISPRNIQVSYTGDDIRAFLIDFEASRPGTARGSVPYAAPERLSVKGGTAKSDIYSLGVLVFEALTGVLPWPEKDPSVALEIRRAHPLSNLRDDTARRAWRYLESSEPGVALALDEATSFEPEKRPANVRELMIKLDMSLAEPPPRVEPTIKRAAMLAALIAGLLFFDGVQQGLGAVWLGSASVADGELAACRAGVEELIRDLSAPGSNRGGLPSAASMEKADCQNYQKILAKAKRIRRRTP